MEAKRQRLSEKLHQPTEEFIQIFMGDEAWRRLLDFEDMLKANYDLNRELKFPFGDNYGWGFRYTHKKTLLFYVFFEENGFCCTISINDKGAGEVETILSDLRPEIQTTWNNRYPCGDFGGWIHYSVEGDSELPDLVRLVGIKVKPKKPAKKS